MRKEYVTLRINPGESTPFITNRRSAWRYWNQLSRLQRNLVYIALVTVCLCLIYFSSLNQPDLKIENVDNGESSKAAESRQLVIPEDPQIKKEFKKDYEMQQLQPATKGRSDDLGDMEERAKEEMNMVNQQDQPVLPKLPREAPSLPIEFNEVPNERQTAVINAFKHAWKGYKKFAWGRDHLKPISGGYHDWFSLGLSIIDSLDTMYIMGLKEEFSQARDWVANGLKLNEYSDVNLFEVTIRVLGGLLSGFHLSGDKMFLEKALDVGERLLPCFTRSPSPIPYSDVNLVSQVAHSPRWGPDSSTSEVTTIQLEFRELSRASNDPKFEEAASNVSKHVHTLPKTDGLVPVFISPKTGKFQRYSDIKLGARGDSYYEYLVKQWIQTGKTQDYLKNDYLEAVSGIEKHLVKRTAKNKLLFIGELKGGTRDFTPKMDHLVCYLPGTLALGHYHGLPRKHMELAQELLETCYRTYSERPTFLAPEITYFNVEDSSSDMYVKSNDAHNLLRPEFIESLWSMYQITGNTTYQDWGWNIFQAFEKYTRVENGYTSINNVNNPEDPRPRDMMESFFLSETLKYFYLLFSQNRKLIDINKYVMNSEAHPLPIHSF